MAALQQIDRQLLIQHKKSLQVLLSVTVWLGAGYLIQTQWFAPWGADRIQAAAQHHASQIAGKLQEFFTARAQSIQAFKKEYYQKSESHFDNNLLPQASLQFFKPQQLSIGSGQPPLNFAMVDLLRRSLKNKVLTPEFFADSNGKLHLYDAVALEQGALLISQPFSIFSRELNKLDLSAGKIQINQKFIDSRPRTLWQPKNMATNTIGYTLTEAYAPISGSFLQVKFIPSKKFASQYSISPYWSYATTALGLLLSLFLIFKRGPWDQLAFWNKFSKRRIKEEDGKSIAIDLLDLIEDTPKIEKAHSLPKQKTAPSPAEVSSSEGKPFAETIESAKQLPNSNFPRQVFRSYDIRGIANSEINEPFAYQLGRALGTLAQYAGETILVLGRDNRNSSQLLSSCLLEGVLDTGCNAVDLGLVPSPLVYYACAKGHNISSGVMVTASHNSAEYNGFKIVLKGRPLSEDKLERLFELMKAGPFKSGSGRHRQQDISDHYIDEIYNDAALAGQLHIVIDAGNGAASKLAPRLFQHLGFQVSKLFCSFDGDFPNHPPDPSRPENLQTLIDAVRTENANLGIALDGDGDRVTLISASGRIAWADQLVMLLARDILTRNPGTDVIFDIKSSRALGHVISQCGGRPLMWKTGHAPMRAKMLETGSLLGGELSGHIFIKDRWYGFDDGIYAAVRILEIMALTEQNLDELLESLPQMINTPEILLPVEESKKFELINKLHLEGDFGDADINPLDGLRIEFADGWGLVRASNTGAALTLRFEAESDTALERIRALVDQQLNKIDPSLVIPN